MNALQTTRAEESFGLPFWDHENFEKGFFCFEREKFVLTVMLLELWHFDEL